MDLPRPFPGSAFSEYYSNQPQFYPGYTGTGTDVYGRGAPPYPSPYDVTGGRSPSVGGIPTNPAPAAVYPKPISAGDPYGASLWATSASSASWDAGKGADMGMVGSGDMGMLRAGPTSATALPDMTSAHAHAHHHHHHHHHVKRKRKTTPQQRLAANIRERRRMCNLNNAFDRLRRRVPAFPHEKRLSRIQTLKLAITYISFMTEIVTGQDIQTLLKQNAENNKHVVWQPYELGGESGSESGSTGFL